MTDLAEPFSRIIPEVAPFLKLEYWKAGKWHALDPAHAEGKWGAWGAEVEGLAAWLQLSPGRDGTWDFELGVEADFLTRIRLTLSLPGTKEPFHIIPGNIFGDNSLDQAGDGHFPNLTNRWRNGRSCSPYWEMRADRGALPMSLICFEGGVGAVSIDPYSESSSVPDGFIRNGVFARVEAWGDVNEVGITLGYRNDPCSFNNKDDWSEATMHTLNRGLARGRIYLRQAGSRMDAHAIVREEYARIHDRATPSLSREKAIEALVAAFLEVNWSDEHREFTNMNTASPGTISLKPWRSLAEIGWTGGGPIGFPLLRAGIENQNKEAEARGRGTLDRIAAAFNPASGLLWDVFNPVAGVKPGTDGWWSGYLMKGCHAAYTNGSAVSYLMRSVAWLRGRREEAPANWLETSLKVLDTMLELQADDGNFGFSYRADRPEVLEWKGFAGVWFVPPMALAYELTGDAKYLASAKKGLAYYRKFVRDLSCWGTPLDTIWANDEEGVLGFIRGAACLHRITGEEDFLSALAEGAEYEYLWRYAGRARPQAAPLKDSSWNSCGGSLTSVSNVHLHPMALIVTEELRYLAEQTGDPYHRSRLEDSVQWVLNTMELYPDVINYGPLGVLSERYCQSDALLLELYPDGTPASVGFSYNGWAAAAALEGLLEITHENHQ